MNRNLNELREGVMQKSEARTFQKEGKVCIKKVLRLQLIKYV